MKHKRKILIKESLIPIFPGLTLDRLITEITDDNNYDSKDIELEISNLSSNCLLAKIYKGE